MIDGPGTPGVERDQRTDAGCVLVEDQRAAMGGRVADEGCRRGQVDDCAGRFGSKHGSAGMPAQQDGWAIGRHVDEAALPEMIAVELGSSNACNVVGENLPVPGEVDLPQPAIGKDAEMVLPGCGQRAWR
ncbi:hypothetical protein ACFSTI_14420 [Rhizorhabdus histidinilytica]